MEFGEAIIVTAHFAIGLGFYQLAQYVPRRIKGNTGKVLSWPCYGLAFIFVGSALFAFVVSMFGAPVFWLLSWF
jgi:hypothetical protein